MAIAMFERFELELTREQALSVSVGGQDASPAIQVVLQDPRVTTQLDAIGWLPIRNELAEYGAWDAHELQDDNANRERIVWIARGNIADE